MDEKSLSHTRDEKIYGAALGGGCTFFAHFQKSLVKFHNKTKNTPILNESACISKSEWRDSNSRPPAPKAGALPTAQHPGKYYHSILFFAAFVNPEVRTFTLPLFVRIFIRKSGCKGRKGWSIMGVEKAAGSRSIAKVRRPE